MVERIWGICVSGSTARVLFDERWRGSHGIGRYATEVVSRLALPIEELGAPGSPTDGFDSLRRAPRMRRGDVLYTPGYNCFRASPQLVTVHDLIHLKAPLARRGKYFGYYYGLLRPAIRRSGVVMTVSETSRQALSEWIADEDVSVVNGGIGCSDEFVPPVEEERQPEGYVLFVGNLRPHKNLAPVLAAVSALDRVRLKLVVPEREVEETRSQVLKTSANGRVDVLSGLDDAELAGQYQRAAATIVPSLLEGFGLPALESVMCGTPVVYWDGCEAVKETVGARGIAVESAHAVQGWADALEAVVDRPRRVEPPPGERFSWNRTAAVVRRTISSLEESSR